MTLCIDAYVTQHSGRRLFNKLPPENLNVNGGKYSGRFFQSVPDGIHKSPEINPKRRHKKFFSSPFHADRSQTLPTSAQQGQKWWFIFFYFFLFLKRKCTNTLRHPHISLLMWRWGHLKKKIKDEIIHISLTWTQRWLLFNFKLPKFEIRPTVLICLNKPKMWTE